MNFRRTISFAVCVAGLTALVGLDALAGLATPSTIIVLPARRRVVELAGQVARIKDVGLVSYSVANDPSSPLIHIWNGAEWIQISMDDYVAGSFMSGSPKNLVVLGDNTIVPERMAVDPAWCHSVQRISSLATASLLNDLDKTLKFTPRQWRWLADRYGLSLTDQNAERRRYGRWGPPGREVESPKLKPAEGVTMPPPVLPQEVKAEIPPEAAAAPVEEPGVEEKPIVPPRALKAEKPADPVIAPPAAAPEEPPAAVAPMDK